MKIIIPSFSRRTTGNSPGGWTIPELMIGVVCGLIILSSLMVVTVFATRSYVAVANYTELDWKSRNTLDVMSQDIRSMKTVTGYTTNGISLWALDGSTVVYNWNSGTSAFTRTYTPPGGTATTTMLLSNCTVLVFHVYSRVPTNSFTFPDTSSNPSQTKLIDVSWRCARAIFGRETNSESVQTAKIVMRN
jgi:Tfp pilus assembly protein PilW